MKFYELDEGTVFRFENDHEETVRVVYMGYSSISGDMVRRSMLLKDGGWDSENENNDQSNVVLLNILKTEPILS